jgi:hypothetical protein
MVTTVSSRLILVVVTAIFLTSTTWLSLSYFDVGSKVSLPSFGGSSGSPKEILGYKFVLPNGNHPIDDLIRQADRLQHELLGKATHSLHDAAAAYRARRGRQPPPWFDRWYALALKKDALVVEELFDPIYDDLNPFWAIPAQTIRDQARAFEHRVIVRNGYTEQVSDHQRDWMLLWADLVRSIQDDLPDLDMPINVMDESRIIAPWEDIAEYMVKEKQTRGIVADALLKTTFQNLSLTDGEPPPPFDPQFEGSGHYWKKAALGCAPGSPGREVEAETDYTTPPPVPDHHPKGTYLGYVQNWTLARQPCEYAELSGLHGSFVEPISMSSTKKLFPLFGGSKLPMNNEILIPPAMYWSDDPRYSGGEGHGGDWDKKVNSVIWRGAGTGGRNKDTNWARFQRHRFVSMVNGTSVKLAETNHTVPNFVLPAKGEYHLSAWQQNSTLGDWVDEWAEAAFVHLLCFPAPPEGESSKHCAYTDPFYEVAGPMPMSEQYNHKYLPDIDGNSFSGRYRGFLGSTSLPIKATIYNEWHDSRLIAWRHFVPMDNTFIDIYGIMDYFFGNKKASLPGHDDQAKQIALAGKDWAEKVLRREDMQIYVLRLLLEYARLCDDDRETMGWAETRLS